MNLPTRYGAGLLASSAVTFGLGVMMAALIRTDFVPAAKAEAMTYDINPVALDQPVMKRTRKLEQVTKVITPPPPPVIERAEAEKPIEAVATIDGAIPDFEKPELEPSDFSIVVDKDEQPVLRIPPIMPPRAEKSGHCKVRFDVSAEGQPYNVQVTYCTQNLFARPTIKSVQKWKYTPKMRDGRAMSRSGIESTVSFHLTDERGRIIPE